MSSINVSSHPGACGGNKFGGAELHMSLLLQLQLRLGGVSTEQGVSVYLQSSLLRPAFVMFIPITLAWVLLWISMFVPITLAWVLLRISIPLQPVSFTSEQLTVVWEELKISIPFQTVSFTNELKMPV